MKPNKTTFCGACPQFKGEDLEGRGWCEKYNKKMYCDMICYQLKTKK